MSDIVSTIKVEISTIEKNLRDGKDLEEEDYKNLLFFLF